MDGTKDTKDGTKDAKDGRMEPKKQEHMKKHAKCRSMQVTEDMNA